MICERMQGKVVLITGGASGVGRATAHRFASEQAEAVVIMDRNAEAVPKIVEEVQASGGGAVAGHVADVTSDDDCERVVAAVREQFGHLDVLISNAPAHKSSPFLELPRHEWDEVLRGNLRSSFVLGQLAARAMVEQGGGGSILYTASVSAIGASMEYASYGASKAGMVNLAKTMAMELVEQGIRVNCVSPGPLDTPQSRDVLGSDEAMERARESWPIVPMQRLGLPQEIAAAFAYLASEDASYVTGINLVVDGGLTSHAYSIPEELLSR